MQSQILDSLNSLTNDIQPFFHDFIQWLKYNKIYFTCLYMYI